MVKFARSLESKPPSTDVRRTKFAWDNWAGAFAQDDVSEMEKAIEDCEKIDEAACAMSRSLPLAAADDHFKEMEGLELVDL